LFGEIFSGIKKNNGFIIASQEDFVDVDGEKTMYTSLVRQDNAPYNCNTENK